MKHLILLSLIYFFFTGCNSVTKTKNGLSLPKADTTALKKVLINLEGKDSKEKILLKFCPEKGSKKISYLNSKSIFNKEVLEMRLNTEMEVLDVLSNGEIKTRSRILDLNAKTKDSEIDGKTSKEIMPLMSGFSFATYNGRGKVIEMKADNPQLDAQFKSNQSNGFIPEFPDKPLGVGDMWQQINKQFIKQEEITLQYNYTIISINKESVSIGILALVLQKGKEIFTIKGMIETDRRTGFPLKGNLEQQVKGLGVNYVTLVVR